MGRERNRSQCPEGRFSTDINTDACTGIRAVNRKNTACVSCDEGTVRTRINAQVQARVCFEGLVQRGAPGQISPSRKVRVACLGAIPPPGRTACLPCPRCPISRQGGHERVHSLPQHAHCRDPEHQRGQLQRFVLELRGGSGVHGITRRHKSRGGRCADKLHADVPYRRSDGRNCAVGR